MLDSDMAESTIVPAHQAVDDGSPAGASFAADDPRTIGLSAPAHRVLVRDAACATYRCMLVWLMTGLVSFTPATAVAATDDGVLPKAGAKEILVLADKLQLHALRVREPR